MSAIHAQSLGDSYNLLISKGYVVDEVKQVPRFGKIYDEVSYKRELTTCDFVGRYTLCLFGSFLSCSCINWSDRFHHYTCVETNDGYEVKKRYFLNQQKTDEFVRDMELNEGFSLVPALQKNYLLRDDIREKLTVHSGHSYLIHHFKNDLVGFHFVPNQDFSKCNFVFIYDSETGKAYQAETKIKKYLSEYCSSYNSQDHSRNTLIKTDFEKRHPHL